ncbi:MAG: 50S ribosomal protein L44e [Nitrososphaeria archaeon]|nr:50S ribosomal protein L44e [Nitrososphaeria archaeon]MDW8021168.1 50S ribosomal protein L44e [Nitrososphaerota archaeon]
MKVPGIINTYCPKCRKNTPHKVTLYKKGKERSLARGARHHERELRGYGGQKYPIQRKKSKTTQKQTLKLICNECGRAIHREGIRMRKLEIAG